MWKNYIVLFIQSIASTYAIPPHACLKKLTEAWECATIVFVRSTIKHIRS